MARWYAVLYKLMKADGFSEILQAIKHLLKSEICKLTIMVTHSSTLAWRIPRMEEPGRLPWGRKELDTTEQLHFHFHN